jgi:hypothetical protein
VKTLLKEKRLFFQPLFKFTQSIIHYRQLYSLHKKTALPLFVKAIKRALKYRVNNVNTIENIVRLLMKDTIYELPLPEVNHDFTNRPAYLEGRFTDEVDLSVYGKDDKE